MHKYVKKVYELSSNVKYQTLKVFFIFVFPSLAFAQSSESPVGQGLSYVINSVVYGTDGVVIATIAIVGVGILCLSHRVEWKYFFYTIAGIAIVFGAPAIVQGIKSLVTV